MARIFRRKAPSRNYYRLEFRRKIGAYNVYCTKHYCNVKLAYFKLIRNNILGQKNDLRRFRGIEENSFRRRMKFCFRPSAYCYLESNCIQKAIVCLFPLNEPYSKLIRANHSPPLSMDRCTLLSGQRRDRNAFKCLSVL